MKLIRSVSLALVLFCCFIVPAGSAGFLDDLTQTLKTSFTETPKDPNKPSIAISGTELKVQGVMGENAQDASFSVKNSGAGSLNFTVKSNMPWVEMSPMQGTSSGDAKQKINLHFKTADLKEGNYVAPIVIEDANAQNSPRTVFVRLSILPGAVLVLDRRQISTKSRQGEKTGDQTFVIQNQGAGNLSYNLKVGYEVSDEAGWILLTPGRGEIPAGQQVLVTVSYNVAKFSAGMHIATVMVEAPGAVNSPQQIQINLQVMSNKTLSLGVKELKLESEGKPSGSQVFRIENTGSDPLNYEIKSKDGWLSAMPLNGALAGGGEAAISVQYDTSSLKPGVYESEIEVRQKGSNEAQKIPVKLEVAAPPVIGLQPAQLSYKAETGKNPSSSEVLNITNQGEGTLRYQLKTNAPWLGVESFQGALKKKESASVAVAVNTSGLQPGEHKAGILVSAPGARNNPQTVPVILKLEAKSQIEIAPDSLSLETKRNTDAPAGTFEVTNSGSIPFVYTIKTKEDWLKVEPAQGTIPVSAKAVFQVAYKTKDLGTGDYTTDIEVRDSQGKMAQGIPVKLTVKAKVTKPTADSNESIYVEPGKTIWDGVANSGKTDLFDGAPGPLQNLVIHLGNAEKMYIRTYSDPYNADGNEKVQVTYEDKLKLKGKFPYKDEKGQTAFEYDPDIWDMNFKVSVFSPRASRAGFAEQEYSWQVASLESPDSKSKKIGSVPGADLSGIYVQKNLYEGQNVQEYWTIIALKEGVLVSLYGHRDVRSMRHVYGAEKDLPPFAEEILKRAADKNWESLFKPDKGDPRYDRLPEKIKPLVQNMGVLSPTWIHFTYSSNNRQPKGWDYKMIGMGFLTEWFRKGDQPSWRCDIGMSFFYPNKTARKLFGNIMKSKLDGYTHSYPDHQVTKIPYGDEAYKIQLYSTSNDGKRYLNSTIYIARIDLATVNFDYSGIQGAEPPAGNFEAAVEYLKKTDIEDIFASADRVINLSGEERPPEETTEPEEPEAEEPPLVLPDDAFWQPESEAGELPVGQTEPLPTEPAATPALPVPEPGVKPGDKNTDGMVWSQSFGDWVKPETYQQEQEQVKLGRIWKGDQRGWETPEETKERDGWLKTFDESNKEGDQKRRADLEKLSQDIRDTKQAIKDAEARHEKVEVLRNRLDKLEDQSDQAALDARWNSKAVLTDTVHKTAREAVTGQTEEGETSYKAMMLRMLMDGASGGYSEVAYNTADASYQVYDHLKNGDSIMGAVAKTTVSMATSEVVGRATAGLVSYGAKKATTLVRTALGEAAETGTEGLSKTLAKKKTAIEKALSIKDEVKQAEAIKKLYRGGGMEDLSKLERAGHLGTNDVKKMNQVITKEVNEAVDSGVKKTMSEFKKHTEVEIVEVMVGDSGSSASRPIRSVKTDADFASLVKFDEASLKKYADKSCGGDVVKAYDKLSKKFATAQDAFVDESLRSKGLSAYDVDYKTYDRFGASAGPSDAYSAGFVKTRQATQGRTTVFTPVEGGEFKSYKTSGQAMTDQEALIKNDLRGGKRSAFENTFAEPKISPNESKSIMEHQVIQSGMSAEKASKALERADKALALSEKTRIDPTLREKARLIRQNPQQAKEILGNMSEEDFVKQIDTAVQQASQDVKGG